MKIIFTMGMAARFVATGFCGLAVAGPFEDGIDAARRADYDTVLRLWRPLAWTAPSLKFLGDRSQDVQKIARGPGQSIEPCHQEHVTRPEVSENAAELDAIALRSTGRFAPDLRLTSWPRTPSSPSCANSIDVTLYATCSWLKRS
jgi:hypothetical protein